MFVVVLFADSWNTRQTPAILSKNPHVRPSFSPCWYKQANRVALTLFSLARAGSQVSRCGLKQASFSNKTLDNRISLAKIKHQDSPLLSVNLKIVDTSSHYFFAYWWRFPKKAEGDSFWFILIMTVGRSKQHRRPLCARWCWFSRRQPAIPQSVVDWWCLAQRWEAGLQMHRHAISNLATVAVRFRER